MPPDPLNLTVTPRQHPRVVARDARIRGLAKKGGPLTAKVTRALTRFAIEKENAR